MPTERDILRSLVDSVDVRGDVEQARRRGDQLRRRRRIVVGGVACLVALIGGGLVAALADGDERNSQVDVLDEPSVTTAPPGSTDIDDGVIDAFETIAPPPVPIDDGTVVLPTAMGVFVWGSNGGRQGALLSPPATLPGDPRSEAQWQLLPDAPEDLGVGPATAAAMGTEVVVLTDSPDGGNAHVAIYDLEQGHWRRIPQPPFRRSEHLTIGWTGQRVVFYGVGSADGCVADPVGYRFDQGTDEWHTVAAPPFGARTDTVEVWAEGQLLVLGGSQRRCPGEPDDPRRDGAAYTAATNTWSEIPPHPGGNPTWAVATSDGVVVFDDRCTDGCSSAAVYDLRSRQWRDLGADGPPADPRRSVALQGQLVGWDEDGRGWTLGQSSWAADAPRLAPELARDPSLRVVGTLPVYAITPGRADIFPTRQWFERIQRTLEASTVADALKIYATGPNFKPFDELPLADEVRFTFGDTVVGTRRRAELADDDAWVFEYPDGTIDGTFSVLELLRERGLQPWGGDFQRCDGSPHPWPPGSSGMHRTAWIHGASGPCDDWWALVIYVRDGEIVAIGYERG